MSLTAYKAAVGTTTTADDDTMQSALNRATALIEGYVGYPLRRSVYQETLSGYGSLELQVSRTPLFAVESIMQGTETVDPDSYDIANHGAGLIYRELGWPWTAGVEWDLMPHPVHKSEKRSYVAVYEAGYCVNGSTESGWLTTGESVPADIEAALVHATTFLHKSAGRDLTVTSKRIGDLSITYQDGSQSGSSSVGLNDVVKGMLSQHRRF